MSEREENKMETTVVTVECHHDGVVDKIEVDLRKTWEKSVLEKYRSRCANCGGGDRVQPRMIVPETAGGKFTESNGVALCRACDLAADAAFTKQNPSDRRLINFWVSKRLYDSVQSIVKDGGFRSMGKFVRWLSKIYVVNENRFDDLEKFQDPGGEVKINVWVDVKEYELFKSMLDRRGLTVADGLRGLIRMYEEKELTADGK